MVGAGNGIITASLRSLAFVLAGYGQTILAAILSFGTSSKPELERPSYTFPHIHLHIHIHTQRNKQTKLKTFTSVKVRAIWPIMLSAYQQRDRRSRANNNTR